MKYGEARLVLAHGRELWVRTDDLRGYWVWRERGTQRALVQIWEQLVALGPALAVDVGANYGEFSLPAAQAGIPSIAIEPNPLVAAQLERTLHSWSNAAVLQVAASNGSGEVALYVPDAYTGGASLSSDVVAGIRSGYLPPQLAHRVVVKALTLDQILAERSPSSLLLKIDVEGFDREVLEGASKVLSNTQWWRALVEFNAETLRQRRLDPADTWRYFAQFPGIAVWGRGVPGITVRELTYRLPDEPMPRANLLIGQGSVEAAVSGNRNVPV